MQRNSTLKVVSFFKSRLNIPLLSQLIIIVSSGIVLFFAASDLYAQVSLDSEIAKALKIIVPCERIEVKTKAEENRSGKLKSLLIKFVSVSKNILPADYITMQYTNPTIDLKALRNSRTFNITSFSDFKIGVLVSEESLKNEFDRMAKRLNMRYNKFLIKFSPPYIELEFDIPASEVSPEDRKLVEKFVKNKKFEGYAALRLEVHDNKIFASPTKIILNHFLLPVPVIAELKRRINPLYQVPRIHPFNYSLEKVGIQKKYIFLSN